MHVRILGSLEVEDGKAPVALGGQRQRALLAVLVLARGSVVSSDRLIDGLWEEEAPATARNVVQGHVSQLRKAFGGNGRLETRGHGYVLHLEQGELDVDQFEELFAKGRRLLTEDDPVAASGALLEALALWRGPALADFAYEPFASAEAARLEDRAAGVPRGENRGGPGARSAGGSRSGAREARRDASASRAASAGS